MNLFKLSYAAIKPGNSHSVNKLSSTSLCFFKAFKLSIVFQPMKLLSSDLWLTGLIVGRYRQMLQRKLSGSYTPNRHRAPYFMPEVGRNTGEKY